MTDFSKKPAMSGQKDVLSKVLKARRRGPEPADRTPPKGPDGAQHLKEGRRTGGRPKLFPGRTGGR